MEPIIIVVVSLSGSLLFFSIHFQTLVRFRSRVFVFGKFKKQASNWNNLSMSCWRQKTIRVESCKQRWVLVRFCSALALLIAPNDGLLNPLDPVGNWPRRRSFRPFNSTPLRTCLCLYSNLLDVLILNFNHSIETNLIVTCNLFCFVIALPACTMWLRFPVDSLSPCFANPLIGSLSREFASGILVFLALVIDFMI